MCVRTLPRHLVFLCNWILQIFLNKRFTGYLSTLPVSNVLNCFWSTEIQWIILLTARFFLKFIMILILLLNYIQTNLNCNAVCFIWYGLLLFSTKFLKMSQNISKFVVYHGKKTRNSCFAVGYLQFYEGCGVEYNLRSAKKWFPFELFFNPLCFITTAQKVVCFVSFYLSFTDAIFTMQ